MIIDTTNRSTPVQPARLPLFQIPPIQEPYKPQFSLHSYKQTLNAEVQCKIMTKPIDTYLSDALLKRLYGYKRFTDNEILLPRSVFKQLNLSQPAWVLVSQPDSYLKIAVAYIGPEQHSALVSGVRFPQSQQSQKVQISPVPLDEYGLCPSQLTDVRLAKGLPCPPVYHVTLQLLQNSNLQEVTKIQLIKYLKNNPQLIQINDTVLIKLEQQQIVYYKVIALKYHRSVHLYERILDIQDKEISTQILPTKIQVDSLSYNQYAGYLVHQANLEDVELFDGYAEGPLPLFALQQNGLLNCYLEPLYVKSVLSQLSSFLNQSQSNACVLYGAPLCGKTFLLRVLADQQGFAFQSIDCLAHFNVTKLIKLLGGLRMENQGLKKIVEFVNFDKYNLILDQGGASQSKAVRDLQEARFASIIEQAFKQLENTFVFVSCQKPDNLSSFCKGIFKDSVRIQLPERSDRTQILEHLNQKQNFDFSEISKYLQGKTYYEIFCLSKMLSQTKSQDEFVQKLLQIEKKRKIFGEKSVRIPEVKWADVGGLADAKDDILQTIMLPIEKPHLFQNGMSARTGLLFYGPPGTGKTLLAKAIATECQMNFISVKGPELLNMYVGESEKNVREVFERARENLPCIIFFDELDSLAPARGKGDSGSGQVMDRIVAQLLTEIDGVGKKPGLFIIGATNRPDLLDSALLRTGRFDKMIYLGVASTLSEKVKIIIAQVRNMKLAQDVVLEVVASKLPPNFTGADFGALTSETYMIAVHRRINILEQEINLYKNEMNLNADDELLPETFFKLKYPDVRIEDMCQIEVCLSDFLEAIQKVVPSISMDELRRYERLRDKYSLNQ